MLDSKLVRTQLQDVADRLATRGYQLERVVKVFIQLHPMLLQR